VSPVRRESRPFHHERRRAGAGGRHDVAAPIDLAIAANANVAAPIDAAVGANILSFGSESAALADQDAIISQEISGEAIATAPQDSTINQGAEAAPAGTEPVATDRTSSTGVETGALPTDGLPTEGVAPPPTPCSVATARWQPAHHRRQRRARRQPHRSS
jgi:hypothetical protein